MSNQMVKGNTAVIIGAMYAGCDCFFGYPITGETPLKSHLMSPVPPISTMIGSPNLNLLK